MVQGYEVIYSDGQEVTQEPNSYEPSLRQKIEQSGELKRIEVAEGDAHLAMLDAQSQLERASGRVAYEVIRDIGSSPVEATASLQFV